MTASARTAGSPDARRSVEAEFLIATAAVAVILLLAQTGHAAEACDPSIARIVSLQGQVEVQSSGSSEWTAAALNEPLCIGDAVRVGPFARAALAFANDSVLRLDQRTTLYLRGQSEAGRSLLELLYGAVNFFSHRPRALEIDTPFVNAGAEGTEFLIRVSEDRTEAIVLEGRVLMRNAQGELPLTGGDAGVALKGEAPQPQIVARPRDAVTWTLYYPPILAPLAERRAAPAALPEALQAAIDRVAANDYAGAMAALDAVPEAARDARYYTYRAGVLLNVGRTEEAAAAIERALALDPKAGEALAQRAVIEVVQNRREEALADARRALELSPNSSAAAIALSYALQASFDLEAARKVLREAVASAPEDALAWARLSEIELSFGNLNGARDAAERAVALAPDLSRTQMVLGFAALTRIDIDQAKARFERAIALDSANPLARLGLGLAAIRAGDLDAGGREIEIAVALDPNDSLLRSYLGKTYFEERRDPLDGQQYAIAKQLDPNDPTPWFYDAIRLQTINRPVEALRNIEKSIDLNDNRAVYRSRLLLDEDLATRGASLARIYDDLGFERLGVLQASKSLSLDPANSSAHRFLADTYLQLPRNEIARASELLQSQLLQPININPVQPRLPLTDLNIASGVRPATASFNEFTPMFERNRAQLTASGVVGNNDTIGQEVVASALWNRLSFSAGQLYSDTDGFRHNNDINNQLYDFFGQYAFTPKLGLQAEYRHRRTEQGDLVLNFDPDDFSNMRRKLNQDTGRIGGRISPSPSTNILLSLVYSDAVEKQNQFDTRGEDKGFQGELGYLWSGELLNIVAGFSSYDIDAETNIRDFDLERHFDRKQDTGYIYTNVPLLDKITLTLGGSVDWYEQADREFTLLSPKVGLEWNVTDDVRLRAAAYQLVQPPFIVGQTLQPTQIAGFNQFFDDINGTKIQSLGVGVDVRPLENVYAGIEAFHRDLSVPTLLQIPETTVTHDQTQDVISSYIYWAFDPQWAFSTGLEFEEIQLKDVEADPDAPKKLNTILVPIVARYFSPIGVFAEFGVNYLYQNLDRVADSTFSDGSESVFLLNAGIGYRVPKRYGIVSLEINNILDQSFDFQDENFFTNETRSSRFIPERTVLARATFNF